MKISFFLLFLFVFCLSAEDTNSQNVNVTLKSSNMELEQVLSQIERQTEFLFVYNNHVNVTRKISVNLKNVPLYKVLDNLFEGTDVKYSFDGTYILLSTKNAVTKAPINSAVTQQRRMVTGKIVDSKGEPVIGANVVVKGTNNGTISSQDGSFSLELPNNDVTLVVSYIGYETQTIPLKGKTSISIELKEDTKALSEVVVTALGIKREEKALGYATQKVTGEKLSAVKTVDFATNLTGKVAGLNVSNSTEFSEAPTVTLRGETPLIVIDGVPYYNITLREVAADDIESVDVLKGATASALYGSRGGSGAIMITTKRANKSGLEVSVNSTTSINAGYLKKPEVQTSYSSGSGGKYYTGDYVWGDKLDIGRTATMYNPYTYEWEEQELKSVGKNNLKNFQEFSFVTNNNVNVAIKGKNSSFRTSLTHVYNKGQWPNEKMNKLTYSVAGDMNFGNFKADAGITYNKKFYPNNGGTGYGGSGYLYNLLIWTGCEYDIRDYKNYWQKKDELSNWMDRSWYENPYYIANEITSSNDYNVMNGFLNMSYNIKPWLKAVIRSGVETSSSRSEYKTPVGSTSGWGSRKGYYGIYDANTFSTNNDALLMANYKLKDFNLDGFVGGTIYYLRNDKLNGQTKGGLIIPGYYSLNASVDNAITSKSYSQKQVNSLYGKFSAAWKSTVFVDFTGRNDWSSTLRSSERSYFYPSISSSVVMSELIKMPEFIDFWKIRGSWTVTKNDLSIYAINSVYTITTNAWNDMTAAYASTALKDAVIKPATSRSYEIGTAFNFLKNRLKFDLTYYNKLSYNNSTSATISSASGYSSSLINIDEDLLRKGLEITLSGSIIRKKDIDWNATLNWARDRYYYDKTDPVYSTQKPWVKKGSRADWVSARDYQRDPDGNIIHGNDGYPLINPYATLQGYSNPDWVWGLTSNFRYKNVSLDVSIDGRVGGIAHAEVDQAMWNSGAHIDSDNQYRYDEVVNGKKTYVGKGVKVTSGSAVWNSDGTIASDNRTYTTNDKVVSYETYMITMNPWVGTVRTQNLQKQTFIKLRSLAINYAIPEKTCSTLGFKSASLGLVGQNLLMWTKDFRFSDPDVGYDDINSPSIRLVGFNLRINF